MNMEDMFLYNSIKKQKLSFASYLLRGSAGETALQILEGRMNSNVAQGRPERMWIDDVKCWLNLDSYESVKSTAQDRCLWITCVLYSMSTFFTRRLQLMMMMIRLFDFRQCAIVGHIIEFHACKHSKRSKRLN